MTSTIYRVHKPYSGPLAIFSVEAKEQKNGWRIVSGDKSAFDFSTIIPRSRFGFSSEEAKKIALESAARSLAALRENIIDTEQRIAAIQAL